MQPFVMFDARDGTLEERKAKQPIVARPSIRVGRGERLDTNKEREQPRPIFVFMGVVKCFGVDKKTKAPIRHGQMLFMSGL